ncbi:MAG: type III secretion system chaperone [Parachlamydiaceae bacterium]|nr:type III secretion system chaperone [Parachlamydiaceae bacterium]
MLNKLIHEFAKDQELGDSLPLDSSGNYMIPLDEGLIITIQALPEGFTLFCFLGPCPKNNREALFSQALLANLFGQGTHDAVLGISEDGNTLTLSRIIDYHVEYKEFKEIIEDFINVVDFWREESSATA